MVDMLHEFRVLVFLKCIGYCRCVFYICVDVSICVVWLQCIKKKTTTRKYPPFCCKHFYQPSNVLIDKHWHRCCPDQCKSMILERVLYVCCQIKHLGQTLGYIFRLRKHTQSKIISQKISYLDTLIFGCTLILVLILKWKSIWTI